MLEALPKVERNCKQPDEHERKRNSGTWWHERPTAEQEKGITITELFLLKLLWRRKKQAKAHDFLTEKPHDWRQRFQECLVALKLSDWGFRPYSLRRGGATSMFVKGGALDRVLLAGRWTAVKTAKIYLNSGLAMLADLKKPFLTHFTNSINLPPKLEPVLKKNRSGGRGRDSRMSKRTKKGGRSRKKNNIA